MDPLTPKDHGEEVAVFRHSLIGELVRRELDHGERSAHSAGALRLRTWARPRPRAPRAALRHPAGAPLRERHGHPAHTARRRARRRRGEGVHRAQDVRRAWFDPRPSGGRQGRQGTPSLAGRASRSPVARGRLPRHDVHLGRAVDTGTHPRAARRCVTDDPGPARHQQRAGGDHVVAPRAGAHGARKARRALPRQRRDLPRRDPTAGVLPPRHHALARQAIRRPRTRQDGALLAPDARASPLAHRADRIAR